MGPAKLGKKITSARIQLYLHQYLLYEKLVSKESLSKMG